MRDACWWLSGAEEREAGHRHRWFAANGGVGPAMDDGKHLKQPFRPTLVSVTRQWA